MATPEINLAIKADGITKWFGEGEARTAALREVNLEIRFGEMVYVVGPSGSGKTTLLSVLSGILRPDSGIVLAEGMNLWSLKSDELASFRLNKIGFAFQDYHLFPRLTVAENVAIPLILKHVEWDKAIDEAMNYLDIMGLKERANLPPVKLSGGEQQRVAIARAIVCQPDILIMDEPTASLDGDTGRSIVSFVKNKVLNENRCILIVTHDSRIYEFANRILHMEDGRLTTEEKEDKMKIKWLFVLSAVGLLGACYIAYFATITQAAQPPLFNPAANPYADGIYAEGIVEGVQSSGENINMYPEVPGTVKQIFVTEGQLVKKGTPLLLIDDSVQRATAEQQLAQAQAAHAMLDELKAEPRKETLDVTVAQMNAAEASLKTAADELDKQQAAYKIDPGSISKDALDSAINAKAVAERNLDVAKRQYDLSKAGAWVYDIANQRKQYDALMKAYTSSSALLAKYTLLAPQDGVVLSINTVAGAYVSSQGAYDTYTQGSNPIISLSNSEDHLNVRCYVDEILVSHLPPAAQIKARMTIRGTTTEIPLTFDRIQPFVSPKIELSDQRQERVDVRVLPIIFQLDRPKNVNLYPGELVDVYIGH